MTTDLFIITYPKDVDWFRWSLKVITEHLSEYRNIHVVLQDWNGDNPVASNAPEASRVIWHRVNGWPGQGYFHQQYIKLIADQYTDAEMIFHFDSDTFLSAPTTVDAFMVNGKPGWMWSYYTDFKDHVPWQAPTEKATGLVCDREFMQATPFLILRSTYGVVRKIMNNNPEHYIRRCAEQGGASFSEFNVLGRLAFEFEHDKYAWIDRNRDPWPKGFHHSRQFWSHAPLEAHLPEIKNMLEGTADPAIRTTDRGIWIMANDPSISADVEKYHRLDYDGHLLPRILPHIKPGMTVVDVGAFIGDHTEAYANAVLGKDKEGNTINTGRVLAFEPNPMPFECLTRNMKGHGHVECINKGLSNFPGAMSISQSPNAGASHMVVGTEVEVTTLDSYALTTCDLIKIDAEGMEMHILQGAWQTITHLRPILVLEINIGALARNGVMPEDIYNWMKLRGYRVTGVEGGPQFDIIAIPE